MRDRSVKKKSIAFALALLLLLLVGCGSASTETPEAILTVTALDVGKADAFILLSEGHTVVIDTATEEEGSRVVDFLEKSGIDRVDELIITHFDKDHVGGANAVIDAFDIGEIYTTYQSKDSDDIDEFYAAMNRKGLTNQVIREKLTFAASGVTYEIFPPEKESYDKDESNNSSLAIRASTANRSMLFTGDAEKKRIKELVKTEGIASDILKMPHHGGIEDNTEKLITAVDPDYAVITSSADEPEDAETMLLLSMAKVDTYLTRNGDITIFLTDDEIRIQQ